MWEEIEDQLNNIAFSEERAEYFRGIHEAIQLLSQHGYITDLAENKMYRRLDKEMRRAIDA